MIVILKKHPDEKQLNNLMAWLKSLNIAIHPSEGATHLVLGLVGDTSVVDIDLLRALDIVEDVKRVQEPYKNANRKFHEEDSVIPVGNTQVGGGVFSVIAGPCSIESEEQVCLIAAAVKARARRCCAAARSSRVPRPTPSRGCGGTGWSCFWRPSA